MRGSTPISSLDGWIHFRYVKFEIQIPVARVEAYSTRFASDLQVYMYNKKAHYYGIVDYYWLDNELIVRVTTSSLQLSGSL